MFVCLKNLCVRIQQKINKIVINLSKQFVHQVAIMLLNDTKSYALKLELN
jgi:hypothetical protein